MEQMEQVKDKLLAAYGNASCSTVVETTDAWQITLRSIVEVNAEFKTWLAKINKRVEIEAETNMTTQEHSVLLVLKKRHRVMTRGDACIVFLAVFVIVLYVFTRVFEASHDRFVVMEDEL